MRGVLRRLVEGEMTVSAVEAALAGYATTEAGRFDAARETRRGVPEAILGDGKTSDEIAALTRIVDHVEDVRDADVAGAQAGLIARAVSGAGSGGE